MAGSSLIQIVSLIVWPLIFSVSTLIWSERQADQINALVRAKASLFQIKRGFLDEGVRSNEIRAIQKELRSESRHHSHTLRQLKTSQRAKFVRLKGIPEDKHSVENTVEKVSELLEYLGFQIEEKDIERANRVGGNKDEDGKGPRAIVLELISERLKHSILREAAVKLRHTPYSILDDETFVVMEETEAMYVPSMNKGCGMISHVTDPVLVKKSGKMFGFWSRDLGEVDHKSIYVMEHFYKNSKVDKYRNLPAFISGQKENVFTLPSHWAGTGHLILNGHVYFNRFNTSTVTMYSLLENKVTAEIDMPDAAFGNMAPYQWAGSTDFDMAYDETGLWIIYATLQNSLDIVISKLDEKTLEILETHRTNWRKQWSGNAFMACGVLYVLKKYEEKYTSLNYIYNTHTDTFKYVDIPFTNKFEWNTMVDYNPNEKALYSWDKGHQVLYNVTFEPSDDS